MIPKDLSLTGLKDTNEKDINSNKEDLIDHQQATLYNCQDRQYFEQLRGDPAIFQNVYLLEHLFIIF